MVVSKSILLLINKCTSFSRNVLKHLFQSDKSSKNGNNSKAEKEVDGEEANNCAALVKQLNKCVERDLLTRFVRTFLLDTNATNIRWQAHALVVAIYKSVPTISLYLLIS